MPYEGLVAEIIARLVGMRGVEDELGNAAACAHV